MSKKWITMLVVSIVLIFGGSFAAFLANSSSGDVDVTRVSFGTEGGELSGLLYVPDGAADEPRPTIVATHGYLNSAEMQAPQAIEMSKRGYVVLALDQYDHGHSIGTMDKPIPFFSFWPTSIYDAVNYMYEQDFVLKDDEGNGIIAASGHSMGGFSSTHAIMLDEMFYEETGVRKIDSYLTMGSDYQWIYALEYELEDIVAAYGPRTAGKIAATYDEFFFDPEAAAEERPVQRKNYIETEEAQAFLGNPDTPEQGEFFENNQGQRVIYQPEEIHPWNHFSMTTTGHAIEFYDEAFADYSEVVQIGESGQSWMYKEWFSFVALIGFFLLFVPSIRLLTQAPVLSNVNVKAPEAVPVPKSDGEKAANLILILFGAFFPALLFTAFYSADESAIRLVLMVNIIIMFTSIAVFVASFARKQSRIAIKKASGFILIVSVIQFALLQFQNELITVTELLGAPTGNPILFWAVNVALITLMVVIGQYHLSSGSQKMELHRTGLKVNPKAIVAALMIAVLSIVIGYALLYLVDALFKTDFRLWTLAVKTFGFHHLMALFIYAPLFFIFYFIVGYSVNRTTSDESFNGIKGYAVSIFMFVGGLVFYLVYHYGLLFTTGTAGFPAESLSSIVVIGLVPILTIAAIYNRYFFKLTGNVYLGAFLNSILMTLILLANTAFHATL
ncbi:serine aminopeptidase domain-containing protein [Bacillus daqingensis]|uniref:Serine aminopeptidase domain-containing protein n=1 Tax=Bacillus daqingensis TaxID=872396 RepID=A0ABV9NXL7_9BACI